MKMKKKNEFVEKIRENINLSNEVLITIGVSVSLSIMLIAINQLYFKFIVEKLVYNIINVFALAILIFPATIVGYGRYKITKEAEGQFPDFLRSISEGIRGGMTLPLAIKYASRSSYGVLDTYIKNLTAQISWGIPFDDAMNNFAEKIGSKSISRSTSAIVEAHNSGGDIAAVIESIGQGFVEIDKLRKERETRIAGQMFQGYMIYFIFIGVMLGLQNFLIPSLSFADVTPGGVGSSQNPFDAVTGGSIFVHLAAIQGFFAGLSVGKLAEGTMSAGIKHAAILALIGYGLMTIFG